MPRFQVYVEDGVERAIERIARSSSASASSIVDGIDLLSEYGTDASVKRFKRLKHVPHRALWEIRVMTSPAYRVLFAPVPGESAFIVLDVVAKSDMARNPARAIDRALVIFDTWLTQRRSPQ